ncbi:MAG: bacteriohemerythrin [Magnetospirillum sp. WYHS-4]
MRVVEWSPELSVGVEVLDFDHEVLVSLINQLADAVADGEDHDVVGSVLNMMLDYTDYHFGREEAIMEACAYPGLAEHRAIHAALKGRVREIRDLYDANPGMVLGEDLMDFLTRWLKDHIMGRDRLYIPSLRGKEMTIAASSQDFDATQPLVSDAIDDDQDFLFEGKA